MKKIKVIALLIGCFFMPKLWADTSEELVITTYYPSPFGVYRELRSKRMAIGDNYYDASQYCWEGSCANTIDADADLIVEGRVGIGKIDPDRPLYVTGSTDKQIHTAWFGDTGGIGVGVGALHDNSGGPYSSIQGLNKISNNPTNLLLQGSGGKIGIGVGMTNPAYEVDVHGTVHADGADLAEGIKAAEDVEACDVVEIDSENKGKVIKSQEAYSIKVAGVISESPGLLIGKGKNSQYKPLALSGQVYCKVTTENGPIKPGDMLVSSSKAGYAMKAVFLDYKKARSLNELRKMLAENQKRSQAVFAKALESLEKGEGKILILIK